MARGFLFCCCLALVAGGATAGEEVHWTYSGKTGPHHWATLCEDYAACAGRNQSPINLTGFVDADLPPLELDYSPSGFEISNNGHTVGVHCKPGSHLLIDGIRFSLLQFHFHSPSENLIEGESFAMEMHLVHSSADGNIAVVAVMISEGDENPALAQLWAAMPENVDVTNPLAERFDVSTLLPLSHDYYRFNGSFTTPPCTEGVRWFVMQAPVTASHDQVAAFTGVMGHPNNRPVQPANARLILK